MSLHKEAKSWEKEKKKLYKKITTFKDFSLSYKNKIPLSIWIHIYSIKIIDFVEFVLYIYLFVSVFVGV